MILKGTTMTADFKAHNYRGLTDEEAVARLETDGYNELPSTGSSSVLAIAIGVVTEPMFLLLVISATLYLFLGDVQEGFLLLGFVFIIMGIEFHQEKKTENALKALKDLASPRALVIRSGMEKRIPGRELVPGDLFIVHEGDRVPADAFVLQCLNLWVDESLLTGESAPVKKTEWTENTPPCNPGGDNLPFVFSGSMIVQGSALVVVTATGPATEIGKIGKALESVTEEPTRLKKEMGKLVARLTIIGITLCAFLVLVFTMTRGNVLNGFLAGITLAMSILPEEFPVILTVFLAIGTFRMSKNNVLTRKPTAVETLGSATVLCTDKTGTLTINRMTVSRLFNGHEVVDIEDGEPCPESFHPLVECGLLASQTNPFDPMEKAIHNLGNRTLEKSASACSKWDVVREYPLTRDFFVMSRVVSHKETNHNMVAAKGAPEDITLLCRLSREKQKEIADITEDFAARGLRVLGVARVENHQGDLPEFQNVFHFTFVGLIGLKDPIRPCVPRAVSECYKAGIRIIMITGDYPVTAINIGRDIGLRNPEHMITGQDLQAMTDEELSEKIKDVTVFARVVPEQKLKIVNALRKNNEIVAMTGDGVNDAPALKAADIGIAMGEKGTDVAREASHLILMDDNFSSIVSAVRMGRRIFDNLRKALGYTFAIHVPITGLALIPVFFKDLPLMLWPVHVVFLEMIIDPACSIIFEAEQEEKNVMMRPPKPIDEPFFGASKIWMSCTQGLFILAAVFSVYGMGIHLGYTERAVRSLTFTCMIAANIATILSNRSWSRNIFHILFTPNPYVKWVIGAAVFFLWLVLNIPILLDLFRFDRIRLSEAAVCAAIGISSITWFELHKRFRLRKKKTHH